MCWLHVQYEPKYTINSRVLSYFSESIQVFPILVLSGNDIQPLQESLKEKMQDVITQKILR